MNKITAAINRSGDNILIAFGFTIWTSLNMMMVEDVKAGYIGTLSRSPLALIAVSLFWWTITWRCYYRLRLANSYLALAYGLFALFGMGAGFGYLIGAANKALAVLIIFATER